MDVLCIMSAELELAQRKVINNTDDLYDEKSHSVKRWFYQIQSWMKERGWWGFRQTS